MGWCACRGRSVRRTVSLLAICGLFTLAILHLVAPSYDCPTLSGGYVSSRLLWQKRIEQHGLRAEFTSTTENILELEPIVDKSPSRSEDSIVAEIQRRQPSLPIAYWNQHKNEHMFFKNESCARFPSLFELEFNNLYWQSLRTSNETFHLFGAYYDVRALSEIGPAVRILGMVKRIEPEVKAFCHLWFENQKEPVFEKVLEYKYIGNSGWVYNQGISQPCLITCKIPSMYHKQVPASVSLVESPCDRATNNLRVIYNKPEKKKGFAVCVKGLDFLPDDLSVRLVEWIELILILGAEKVYMYELHVHPNISKVLRYYEKQGKVEVTPLTLPGGQPNVPGFQHMYIRKKINHKRRNEVIPYNDCFYKNLYTYEYIAVLDVDEVIMPINAMTWRELMDEVLPKALAIRNETRASYNARNVYFLDDLIHAHGWFKDMPRYMHMLQHVYRSKNFTALRLAKSFHNTERVLTVHNHYPLACLGSGCTSYLMNTTDAQLQHYRADCSITLKKECVEYRKNSVMDTTIWKYRDKLIARTTETLKKLGFFGGPRGSAAQSELGSMEMT